jgi:DNA-binding response OmpR family regulator
MRVLLVEDEVRLAENVANALRDGPGFAVDCAEDGTTGAHLAGDRCYDLIVLDLMLPGIDGLSLLKRLRARGGNDTSTDSRRHARYVPANARRSNRQGRVVENLSRGW